MKYIWSNIYCLVCHIINLSYACIFSRFKDLADMFPVNLVIKADKLTFHEKLGTGGCGVVIRVSHKDRGQFAIKKLAVQTEIEELDE